MKNLSKWYEKGNYFDKGEIVKALIHKATLTKDNDIIPTYRLPFNMFASAKNKFGNINTSNGLGFSEKGIRVGNLYDQLSKSSLSLPHIKKVKKYQELKKKKEKATINIVK